MTETTNQLLLIDLSAIAHQIWHVSGAEPDPNFVSTQIIARVRALASAHPAAAVCCDSGKSFRADLDPTYKANRDTENRAPLKHQMTLACETLKRDGFPIWAVKGYEADDVIATATLEALNIDGTSVLIASADKDLLQLVSDRVSMKKINGGGEIITAAGVQEKFKVDPSQMGDYLALVGDTSDNIVGAKGIGGVTAAKLLAEHGSLKALYEKMALGVVPGVTPAMRTSLMEFKDRWPLVAQLIALRTDAPIPFAEVAVERTSAPMVEEAEMEGFIEEDAPPPAPPAEVSKMSYGATVEVQANEPIKYIPNVQAILDTPKSAPVDFSQQLEPRSMPEAVQLAQRAFDSKLFGAFGTPQAVLMTVLAGRELGLSAMASLRAIHVIENKPCLSADTMRALVLKSGLAGYFRCVETTIERATFETQRKGDPQPTTMTFTIADAQTAGVIRKGSGWEKYPGDMLRARASAKLCRLVYPDVISGLYDPSEL
jgi:5'-3' exonuclease